MATIQYEVIKKDTKDDVTAGRDWLISPDGKLFAVRDGSLVSPKVGLFDVIIVREVKDE